MIGIADLGLSEQIQHPSTGVSTARMYSALIILPIEVGICGLAFKLKDILIAPPLACPSYIPPALALPTLVIAECCLLLGPYKTIWQLATASTDFKVTDDLELSTSAMTLTCSPGL